jgi:large conductance mechanosensitive channel
MNWGVFINTLIDFIIVAFVIFLVIKAMNTMTKKEPAPAPAPSEKTCPECMMVIPIAATRCGHCTTVLKK